MAEGGGAPTRRPAGRRRVVAAVAIWEGYKALGRATDDTIGPITLPAKTDDLAMPHVWTIGQRFLDPEVRGSNRTVAQVVLEGMWFTFRVAMVGFVIGVGCRARPRRPDAAVPDRGAQPAALRG